MFKGSEYWGYTHQKWNGTYKSAEEELEEMDKQWNRRYRDWETFQTKIGRAHV